MVEAGPKLSGTAIWIWAPDSSKILLFPSDVETGTAYLLDPGGRPLDDGPMGIDRPHRLAAVSTAGLKGSWNGGE